MVLAEALADGARAKAVRRPGIIPVLATVIVGAALSGLLFLWAQSFDDRRVADALSFRAEWRARDLEAKIKEGVRPVATLAAFVAAADTVTAEAFLPFAALLRREGDGVRGLTWVPRITHEQREAFEAQGKSDSTPDFLISEVGPGGSVRPAGARSEYFPLLLTVRFDSQRTIRGIDLLTDVSRGPFMLRARDEGAPVAGLMKVPPQPAAMRSLQVYWPVFGRGNAPTSAEERRSSLRGFAVGLFRLDQMLQAALLGTPEIVETIDLYFDSEQEGEPPVPVASILPGGAVVVEAAGPPAAGRTGTVIPRTFTVMGQRWTMISTFTPAMVASQGSQAPLYLFLTGLLLTALVAVFVQRQAALKSRAETLISDQSRRLSAADEQINREQLEKRKIERALARQGRTTAAAVEAIPLGIVFLDPALNVQFWTRAAEEMFAYPAADVLNQRLPVIAPEEEQAFIALIDEMRDGIAIRSVPLHCRRRDGRPVSVSFSGAALFEDDAFAGVVAIFEDVTQRKALETELLQAQKMEALGQLTGGLAHDFNNILLVVMGNIQLLMEMRKEDGEVQEFGAEAYRAAERGAELVRSLLAFARRQPLQPVRSDINRIVTQTANLLKRVLGQIVTVEIHLGADTWPVTIDPAQLEAALANLATNARDAMPRGGRLTITTANRQLDADHPAVNAEVPVGDYAMIEVSDNGSGIPADILDQIFQPFFTTKERGKGSGLGLSMVFGFVKQSGGHIAVSSEVGAGTSFRLYLPRHRGEEEAMVAAPSESLAAGGGETVLVVEDDAALRRLVLRSVTSLGYRVIEADSAAAALDLLDSGARIDLVFSDIVMAGKLDGLDLARIIPARRPGVKVVLTSGFPDTRLGHELDELNSVILLSKPYRKTQLARALRDALRGGMA